MTCMSRLRFACVALMLATAFLAAPESSASCPAYVYSYTYTEGCGTTPVLVGDDWKECSGIQGGWGTTGNWRERIKFPCALKCDVPVPPGVNCTASYCVEGPPVYTWWVNCGSGWSQRTQQQMIDGDCNCP